MEDKPIGYRIGEVTKLFRETVKRYALELGLSATHFNIIHYLDKNQDKDITQNDLCLFLQFKASTVSLTLHTMEQEGLLYKEKSKVDERKTYVRLTKYGLSKAVESRKAFKASDDLLLNALSEDELELFYSYLDRLKNVMVKKVEK